MRPLLAGRRLSEITTDDVIDLIDRLLETPSEANHLHSSSKAFFNWAVSRRHIKISPIAGLKKPAKVGERERVLSDAELVAIYRAAQNLGHPFGYIVLICIHTGMRRGEVGSLKRSYVAPDYITLPGWSAPIECSTLNVS